MFFNLYSLLYTHTHTHTHTYTHTHTHIYIYIYYTRMLWAKLNKSWRQHHTRHQLYGHLPLITKTIQVRRTRHAGHCWRSKDELVSYVLLWSPTYGQAKAGRPAWTYIQQLCEDTGCNPEDLPEAMNDREKWREMVWDIRAGGTTWWYIYIYIFLLAWETRQFLIVQKNVTERSLIRDPVFTPPKTKKKPTKNKQRGLTMKYPK